MASFSHIANLISAQMGNASYCIHVHGGDNPPVCIPPQHASCLLDPVKSEPGAIPLRNSTVSNDSNSTGNRAASRRSEQSSRSNSSITSVDHDAMIEALTIENATKDRRIAELKVQLEDVPQGNDQRAAELEQLQADIERANEERDRAQNANHDTAELNARLQGENADLTNRTRALEERVAQVERTARTDKERWTYVQKKSDAHAAKLENEYEVLQDWCDRLIEAITPILAERPGRNMSQSVSSSRSRAGSTFSRRSMTRGPSSHPELNGRLQGNLMRDGSVKQSPAPHNGTSYATKRPRVASEHIQESISQGSEETDSY